MRATRWGCGSEHEASRSGGRRAPHRFRVSARPREPRRRAGSSGHTWRLLLAAIAGAPALALAACGDDGGDDGGGGGAPSELVGGWSNAGENRYACVAGDGRLWLGDSATEIGGDSYCAVAGRVFHCSAREDNAAFDGTIEVAAGELAVAIEPCPSASGGDCSATYQRDPNVRCE